MSMTLEPIRAAHARIAPYIVQTPLLRLPALEFQARVHRRGGKIRRGTLKKKGTF